MRGEPVRGEGRKQMKEDKAGSNERGSRREERTRQGKEIGLKRRKNEGQWRISDNGKRKRRAGEGKDK